MKTLTVYQSDNGRGLESVYLKKSEALADDVKAEAYNASKKMVDTGFFGHTQNHDTLSKALILCSEQAVSPGKLNRAYRRIWKIRKAVQLALDEERIAEEEEIPF